MVASVTTIGCMRRTATKKPLKAPDTMPMPTPAATSTKGDSAGSCNDGREHDIDERDHGAGGEIEAAGQHDDRLPDRRRARASRRSPPSARDRSRRAARRRCWRRSRAEPGKRRWRWRGRDGGEPVPSQRRRRGGARACGVGRAQHRHAALPVRLRAERGAENLFLGESLAGNLRDDCALIEHQRAIGEMDELGNLGGIEQHGAAGVGIGADQAGKARSWCRRRCRGSDRTAAGRGFPRAAIWRWRSSAGCRRKRRRPASTARGGRRRRDRIPPRPPRLRARRRSAAAGEARR